MPSLDFILSSFSIKSNVLMSHKQMHEEEQMRMVMMPKEYEGHAKIFEIGLNCTKIYQILRVSKVVSSKSNILL